MKRFAPLLFNMGIVVMLPAIAYANAGPAILYQFGIHLVFLTWLIGLGEGLLLCILFRAWRLRLGIFRIFIPMIAANVASAWIGSLFVNSGFASRIMGDVTIKNLMPTFWTMVYVTFALTVVIEFPFFLYALYGHKRLVLKAVATTLFIHGISYILLFNWYTPVSGTTMVTVLEVVPASAFEMKGDYNMYYLSPDGKQVLRSDLAGNYKEVIASLALEGVPNRLCACPRKVTKEIKDHETVQRVCWESGFDLYVLINVNDTYETNLLLEKFSQCAAVKLQDSEYYEGCCDTDNHIDFGNFRSFGDVVNWRFFTESWGQLHVYRTESISVLHTSTEEQSGFTHDTKGTSDTVYQVETPFLQWPVRNGTHIAGDYGVFQLGKDQICILDPAKKRIALIARGFGPVVAKPPLDNVESLPVTPEEIPQEDVHTDETTPEKIVQDSVQTNESTSQKMEVLLPRVDLPFPYEN